MPVCFEGNFLCERGGEEVKKKEGGKRKRNKMSKLLACVLESGGVPVHPLARA